MVSLSRLFGYKLKFITSRQIRNFVRQFPSTPKVQRLRAITYIWFGLFPFRSPLLRESHLLSFPEGTQMFQFPSLTSITYIFSNRYPDITQDRFPHSEISGSKPVQRLPEAYRSLPRLSSPPGTKASTICPLQLDHKTLFNYQRTS